MKTPYEGHRARLFPGWVSASISPQEYLISASYLGSCRFFDRAVELALLLEKSERSASPATATYNQVVVCQLRQILVRGLPANDLQCLLEAFPATAELFENIHFEHFGLSRAPLLDAARSAAIAQRLMTRLAPTVSRRK